MNDNPLRGMSRAQMMAFAHKEHGEEGLRKALEYDTPQTKEDMLDAVDELRIVGLDKVADIIAEYLDTWPSKFDESLCPFNPKYQTEVRVWKQGNAKRRKEWENRRN